MLQGRGCNAAAAAGWRRLRISSEQAEQRKRDFSPFYTTEIQYCILRIHTKDQVLPTFAESVDPSRGLKHYRNAVCMISFDVSATTVSWLLDFHSAHAFVGKAPTRE